MIRSVLLLLAGIMASSVWAGTSAMAEAECVFDPASVETPAILETDAVSIYYPDADNMRIQGIFREGGLFSVRYWACNHYGARAVLLIAEPEGPPESDELIRLASLLPATEARLAEDFVRGLTDVSLEESARITIPAEGYSEFYLSYEPLSGAVFVEIVFNLD